MHGVTVENNLLGSLPNIITIIIYTSIDIIMNAMESVWLKKSSVNTTYYHRAWR